MAALRRILRTVAWGLVGILISAFLVGYAAPFLPPDSFWWTNLFAVLVPSLGIVVALLAVLLLAHGAYRGKWGRVAVAVGLGVLLVLRFGIPLQTGERRGDNSTILRLMTMNVPPSAAKDWTSGAVFSRFVHQERPDVLALQESWIRTGTGRPAGLRRVAPSLRSLLADSSDYSAARVLPPEREIHQPVFGRLSPDSTSVHPLPPSGETEPRSRYTRTVFTWQGRPAVLYNVHLHSIGPVRPWNMEQTPGGREVQWRAFLRSYRTGAFWRAEQARLLRRRIEEESHPVLVVGDFNSTPHQWAYRHLARGLQGAGDHGGWAHRATYPARDPIVRIDHILVDPAWDIVVTEVPAPYRGGVISDHRPVAVQLRWREDYSE